MNAAWALLVLLGLCVWSSEIGADAPWPDDLPPPPPPLLGPMVKANKGPPSPHGTASRLRPLLPVDTEAALDRSAFIRAFKRQAEGDLISCLQEWTPSPSSEAVSAVLDRQGRLRHLISLNPARPLPECAEAAIAAMEFAASGKQLVRPTVVLQWRIDW